MNERKSDKHSSLLRFGVNYGRDEFCETGPVAKAVRKFPPPPSSADGDDVSRRRRTACRRSNATCGERSLRERKVGEREKERGR